MQSRLGEAPANTVCLRMTRLGRGVFDAVYAKVEFIIMLLELSAIFRASVRQDADKARFLREKERQNPVVQEVGAGDGRFGCVQLGGGPLGVGNASHA